MPLAAVANHSEKNGSEGSRQILQIVAQVILRVFDDPKRPGSLRPENIIVFPITPVTVSGCIIQVLLSIKRNSPHATRVEAITAEFSTALKEALVRKGLIMKTDTVKASVAVLDMKTATA